MLLARLTIVFGITIALFTYYRRPPAGTSAIEGFYFSESLTPLPSVSPSPIVSLAIDPQFRHSNTEIYELDNFKFEQALRKTFQRKCFAVTDIDAWTIGPDPPPSKIVKAYEEALRYIQKGIKTSPHFMIPSDSETFYPDDAPRTPVPLRLYNPRLVSYKTNADNVLLQIECILHREAKYNGKHVEMWVQVNKKKQISVIVANVVGIIIEDSLRTS